IIAKVWLGEIIPRTTLIAIFVSLAGVVLVVSGATGSSSLFGDSVALLMTVSFAIIIVISKAYPGLKILEVTILSTLLTSLLFLPFATTHNVDLRNLAIASTYGFTNMVLAFFLFVRGARHIPAA